ncbi:breast carcinoma-amplified sequence 4 isoform X2 [Ahaetulla prasina]|uniref:breast carcinoma-amplified sequence 4 isoform X2 n=1 Tax=Ahaetulla prasina TaxID=499056 RepID=UPI0026472264|nr:breast carcinoma-amplified sequence 4 isoform X2 [Ahaetulla prasina]
MSQAAAEGGAAASGGRPSPPASSSSSSAFPAIDGWAAELIADAAENGEPRRKAAAEEEEARPLPYCLPPETGKEMKEVEECIEEMLIRLDEFCGMTDMIRSDTSILLEEMIPLIKAKVSEMNNVYTKVDKLEAFVKMAGHHVSFLEEQILQAEKTHAGCPSSIQKLLGSLVFPLFKKTYTPDAQKSYNLPELYRTEDYFPIKCIGSKYQSH